MMFNATFNNISVTNVNIVAVSFISRRSVLLVEETTDLPQVTDKLYHIILNPPHLAQVTDKLYHIILNPAHLA